ncbi:hypothetical protein [Streptomyces lutosisoli]|uniref:Uncharacterized protein n=1 Tax=Streptomyces lutosisoli TaxID=2665721 RepID=A0ABW2VG44_9ACTN
MTGRTLGEHAVGYELPCAPGLWVGHPDEKIDVTVMPLEPALNQIRAAGVRLFVCSIQPSMRPSDSAIDQLDAAESVTFVGYPSNLYDRVHNTPIIRQGTTATPVQLDWNGRPQFLIDASVFLAVVAVLYFRRSELRTKDLAIVYKWTTIEDAIDEMCRTYDLTRRRVEGASWALPEAPRDGVVGPDG